MVCEQMGFLKAIYQARFLFSDHYHSLYIACEGAGEGVDRRIWGVTWFSGRETVGEQSSITEIKWRTKEN